MFIVDTKGSLLVEVLLALAIAAIACTAIASGYLGSLAAAETLKNNEELRYETRGMLEDARVAARMDFGGLVNTTRIDEKYTKKITVENIDDMTKDISVQVSFIGSEKRSAELATRFFDWRHAEGAKLCDFEGDWSAPRLHGFISLGASTTATQIAKQGHFIYIAADSSVQDKSDFFIVDVFDVDHPFIVSQLNTGPGILALAVAGNYVYAGNSSINAQLQIIDVKNPTQPILVSSYKLPGVYNDGTTIANTLYYSKSRIFLGTKKSMIAELHMIDVTDPFSPFELGTWEANTAVNALRANGTMLLVASPDSEELKVLDISNPALITRIGGFDAAGNSGNGKSLYSIGTTTYLGRTFGNNELYTLVAASSSLSTISSVQIGASVQDLVAGNNLLILATSDASKELQIFSVTDAAHPTPVASLDFPAKAHSLGCGNNVLYVGLESSDALRIITPQ